MFDKSWCGVKVGIVFFVDSLEILGGVWPAAAFGGWKIGWIVGCYGFWEEGGGGGGGVMEGKGVCVVMAFLLWMIGGRNESNGLACGGGGGSEG
mmetsp:Transcript_17417/g.24013  ORF Transcript_17417/g.24013 Transcript_17417/m.24013 type:complete len:94 (-) Transcript_17417:168-449(-)